jgi:hypothetical protein
MSLFSIKIARLVLALSVSFWMAGAGCMLGCGNSVSAAEGVIAESADAPQVVIAGDACASAHSHDCCAKQRSRKTTAKRSSNPEVLLAAVPSPMGMEGCPLAVNSTAAISKPSSDQSIPDTALVDSRPLIQGAGRRSNIASTSPLVPNRGPTYLLCCVFLI